MAKSINIVLEGYKKGLDWKETRQLVLDYSADLGWFQAPANIAYFVIGWLYGEGDFKKSLLIAINCGDDTDCTGATLGSILGIIYGAKALPVDWKKHVGDDIITIAIDRGSWWNIPATCTDLTNRVIRMTPQVLAAHRVALDITPYETELAELGYDKLKASKEYLERMSSMNSAIQYDFIHSGVEINYISGVNIRSGQEATISVNIYNKMPDPRHLEITYFLPEGFELLEGRKHLNLLHNTDMTVNKCSFTVKIRAGLSVRAANRGVIQIVSTDRPTVIFVPLLFLEG